MSTDSLAKLKPKPIKGGEKKKIVPSKIVVPPPNSSGVVSLSKMTHSIYYFGQK
jgi:hypothetical protein